MPIRFSETSLATGPDRYRLLGQSRQVILELQGEEIEEAIRGGFSRTCERTPMTSQRIHPAPTGRVTPTFSPA